MILQKNHYHICNFTFGKNRTFSSFLHTHSILSFSYFTVFTQHCNAFVTTFLGGFEKNSYLCKVFCARTYMIEITRHTIDIEKILASKLGEKMKYVPKFAVNWLKRIAHEDLVNRILWDNKGLEGYEWLEACLKALDITVEVQGIENLPAPDDPKRYTFVSNHPLGGPDGVAIGAVIGRHFNNNFRYIVNDILMALPGLAPLCIPVNTTTKKERSFPAVIEAGFASEHHLLLFPAGLCSRKIDGKIQDLEWKKTFISKSVETHRDVVPIFFSGRNSEKFYRIANICKLLHLKVNIAMLYLVDEMVKNSHKAFTIKIGKPIPYETFDKSRKPKEWAAWVRQKVYEL